MLVNDDNLAEDYLHTVSIDDCTLDEVIEHLARIKAEHANDTKYKEFRFHISGNFEDGYYVDLRGAREMTEAERKYYDKTTGEKERAELARLKAKYPDEK